MLKRLLFAQHLMTGKGSLLNEAIESAKRADTSRYFIKKCVVSTLGGYVQNIRDLHVGEPRRRGEDRRIMISSLPRKDEGTEGEKGVDIDSSVMSQEDMFPDENTPARLFGGIIFRDLPICNIKASKNNTIITVSDAKGAVKLMRSCGMEGFKNTRKGTNIAAQATAISLSTKAVTQGYKTVRVRVRGLGPGRMSAIKGLQMGGLDIISVTDNTPVFWYPKRARKRRKL